MSQPTPTPQGAPQHLVVMGVAGVGKTTVAVQLARRLAYESAEGDDFHPPQNVQKMSAGVPLDDADRMPWLRALAGWMRAKHTEGISTVMTCSALRRRYRFRDFSEAFGFMSRVALLAESAGHHPDWANSWNTVDISLTTHSEGSTVTDRDRSLAAAIDGLLA